LYERGLHALQAKRYREAAETLKRVIAEFPEEIELHERAQLYIRVCERQLAPPMPRQDAEEQVYAATLALNAGTVDRAVSLLTVALQRQADNDAAEYMLGVALAIKGDQQGRCSTWGARWNSTRTAATPCARNPNSRPFARPSPAGLARSRCGGASQGQTAPASPAPLNPARGQPPGLDFPLEAEASAPARR